MNKFIAISLLVLAAPINVSAQTETQVNAFTRAAKFDDATEVKSLLKQGVNPNTLDPNGNPMLLLAVKDKSEAVIEVLLADKRTDVDLSNKYGETPLMMASIQGDLPMVKTLVKQKNAMVDHIGWTPLHYACTKGQLEVAQFLISNGATVDSRSLNGTTPLMMAVQSGNEQLVKFLLDNGADLQAKNNLGMTAIDIADIYDKPWIGDGLRARWLKLYKKPYTSSAKPKAPTS
jgi:ankyrin repeat protein